jgi:hypothetical protein
VTSRRSLLLAIAILGPSPAHAQDLIANGHFHVDLAGWTGPGVQAWSPLDWQGDAASGSLHVTNSVPKMFTVVSSMTECLPLSGPGTYELGAEVHMPSQGLTGAAWVTVDWYTNAACTGVGSGSAATDFVPPASDSWIASLNSAITIPAGGVAARVRANVAKNADFAFLSARFDRVRFGPAGTTPVELQGLAVE